MPGRVKDGFSNWQIPVVQAPTNVNSWKEQPIVPNSWQEPPVLSGTPQGWREPPVLPAYPQQWPGNQNDFSYVPSQNYAATWNNNAQQFNPHWQNQLFSPCNPSPLPLPCQQCNWQSLPCGQYRRCQPCKPGKSLEPLKARYN